MATVPGVAETPSQSFPERARQILGRIWTARPDWLVDKTLIALATTLVTLLILFLVSLSYLTADRPGAHLTLDALVRAARDHQLQKVTFRDEDAVAVGTLV